MTKIMEMKTLRSPSLTGTPKLQLFMKQPLIKKKKNQNLAEKIFYKESYKDKTTIRWV